MERIFPPPPAPVISLEESKHLQRVADEIEVKSWELIKDIFGGVEYVEIEELLEWVWERGGRRELTWELGYEFLGAGMDRLVFGINDFYVGKVEFFGTGSNDREWDLWHRLLPEQQVWLSRPYAKSEDDSVIVMERLQATEGNTDELRAMLYHIQQQEVWMDDLLYDLAWYNWGYRNDSNTPVVLDYGH